MVTVSLALATVAVLVSAAATLAFYRLFTHERARAERYAAALVYQQGDPGPAKMITAKDVKKVEEKLDGRNRPRQIGMSIR